MFREIGWSYTMRSDGYWFEVESTKSSWGFVVMILLQWVGSQGWLHSISQIQVYLCQKANCLIVSAVNLSMLQDVVFAVVTLRVNLKSCMRSWNISSYSWYLFFPITVVFFFFLSLRQQWRGVLQQVKGASCCWYGWPFLFILFIFLETDKQPLLFVDSTRCLRPSVWHMVLDVMSLQDLRGAQWRFLVIMQCRRALQALCTTINSCVSLIRTCKHICLDPASGAVTWLFQLKLVKALTDSVVFPAEETSSQHNSTGKFSDVFDYVEVWNQAKIKLPKA